MENSPKRKSQRLKRYDYSQIGAYFITLCVKNRKCILSKVVGGDALIAPHISLTKYGIVAEKYIKRIIGIDKYVIMPNHIHLIIFNSDKGAMKASLPTISQQIKSLKIMITKEVGFSLFQRSFYDHIIRDDNDYQYHLVYIEENPFKWTTDELYEDS